MALTARTTAVEERDSIGGRQECSALVRCKTNTGLEAACRDA
jgi:hypothetical protein